MTKHIVNLFHIPGPAPIPASMPQKDVRMPVPEPVSPPFPEVENFSTGADSAFPVPEDSIHQATSDEDPTSEFAESESGGNDSDEPCEGGGHTFESFFNGARNVSITGNANFQRIDGDVTNFGPSKPGFSGIPFDSVNGDWPFGPNNNPFARQSASRTRSGPYDSSATAGTSSSNNGRGNHENRNATSSSTSSEPLAATCTGTELPDSPSLTAKLSLSAEEFTVAPANLDVERFTR